ncbi:SDR family NAD(P)-dependent oxidoreductase [Synechococcus sp. CS-1331]|uniref:oxidoreductase n=1 Tax=Synechococcus sp. CS-1331 TaxID=2847973 RepID=UPI00223C260A|nr:oxidoreductase [Synechococcus sp. CS-1331]MCT0226799.1 SDR family NAD(P)-dependent oxidoreductase [Synechococcus sp. CS-1331]
MHPNTARPPVALVTGASSGIGLAAAQALLERGFTVVGAARRQEPMAPLVPAGLQPLALDLAEPASIAAAAERLAQDHPGGIDLLVNNAGYGVYGSVEETPLAVARRQFEVNLFGLADLTQRLLPAMRQRRSGRIINVSSMGGRIYAPLGAWYHASKHALEGWSDCLRLELADFGIHVVVVQPGIIRTNFAETMQQPLLERSANGPYGQLTKILLEGFADIYDARRSSSPNLVGSTIAAAACAAKPRSRYVVGYLARPLLLVRNLLGDRIYDSLTMANFRRR